MSNQSQSPLGPLSSISFIKKITRTVALTATMLMAISPGQVLADDNEPRWKALADKFFSDDPENSGSVFIDFTHNNKKMRMKCDTKTLKRSITVNWSSKAFQNGLAAPEGTYIMDGKEMANDKGTFVTSKRSLKGEFVDPTDRIGSLFEALKPTVDAAVEDQHKIWKRQENTRRQDFEAEAKELEKIRKDAFDRWFKFVREFLPKIGPHTAKQFAIVSKYVEDENGNIELTAEDFVSIMDSTNSILNLLISETKSIITTVIENTTPEFKEITYENATLETLQTVLFPDGKFNYQLFTGDVGIVDGQVDPNLRDEDGNVIPGTKEAVTFREACSRVDSSDSTDMTLGVNIEQNGNVELDFNSVLGQATSVARDAASSSEDVTFSNTSDVEIDEY